MKPTFARLIFCIGHESWDIASLILNMNTSLLCVTFWRVSIHQINTYSLCLISIHLESSRYRYEFSKIVNIVSSTFDGVMEMFCVLYSGRLVPVQSGDEVQNAAWQYVSWRTSLYCQMVNQLFLQRQYRYASGLTLSPWRYSLLIRQPSPSSQIEHWLIQIM